MPVGGEAGGGSGSLQEIYFQDAGACVRHVRSHGSPSHTPRETILNSLKKGVFCFPNIKTITCTLH